MAEWSESSSAGTGPVAGNQISRIFPASGAKLQNSRPAASLLSIFSQKPIWHAALGPEQALGTQPALATCKSTMHIFDHLHTK